MIFGLFKNCWGTRVEFDGATYHVTSRGNAREDIFDDDGDRKAFLECLGKVINRFNRLCHAYCLMDNHYHLVSGRNGAKYPLKTLFAGKLTKTKRDARIVRAVHRYGYSQREVADFLELHYATVSRLANRH